MTNLSKKAKLLVTFPAGEVEVFPCVDDYGWSFSKNEDFGFYRKIFSQKLLFTKEEYKLFLAHEMSCDRCVPLPFQLVTRCSGQDNVELEGAFHVNDGDWNMSKCEVLIAPRVEDEYTCLLDNWEEEYNILDASIARVELESLLGDLVCDPVTAGIQGQVFSLNNVPFAPAPSALGWTAVRNEVFGVAPVAGSPGNYEAGNLITTYCREEYNGVGVPAGTGWVLDTGVWVRPITVSFNSNLSDLDPSDNMLLYVWSGYGYNEDYSEKIYDNGVYLNTILPVLLQDCEYQIKSDFYGINPVGDSPSNDAYDCAILDLQELVLFQIRDVKNADAYENATIANVSFKQLITNLRDLHNIGFIIENGVLIIEHVSFFEQAVGMDLVTDYPKAIKGKKSYTYQSSRMPKLETWQFPNPTSPFFGGSPIRYENCYTEGLKEERTLSILNTDIEYISSNPDEIGNAGLVLVSSEMSGGVGLVRENNISQSLPRLHDCYWRHDRPQFQGILNGQNEDFETAKRIRKQDTIEISLCCTDLLEFSPYDLITTQLGDGELLQASYSVKDKCMKLEILHDQIKCGGCCTAIYDIVVLRNPERLSLVQQNDCIHTISEIQWLYIATPGGTPTPIVGANSLDHIPIATSGAWTATIATTEGCPVEVGTLSAF